MLWSNHPFSPRSEWDKKQFSVDEAEEKVTVGVFLDPAKLLPQRQAIRVILVRNS